MPNQSIGGRVRNFANLSKPDIQVHLDNDEHNGRSYINSFSTGDEIKGKLSITAPHDTRFDDLEIALVGFVKTYVDRISPSAAISARSEAFQMFLKMEYPVSESDLPGNGILKAEHTYEIPFTFVVPGALPGSCKHKTSSPAVKDMHLQLPPSLGDPEMSGRGSQLIDDCAPDMVKIVYSVRARLHKVRETAEKKTILSERSRRIRVVPGYDEQPPVTVDEGNDDYCLRAEKNVRKSLIKGKIGRLVVEASQPKSLHLPKPTEDPSCATTTASVQLRFDPCQENSEPPKLGMLAAKLKIGTFFASTPRVNVPTGKSATIDHTQAVYVDLINLSSRNVSGIEWTKHEPSIPGHSASLRRDSAMSMAMGGSAECPAPSEAYKSNLPFYTAQVLVPISPPKNKLLVPSFQQCICGRVYVLELTMNLPGQSNLALKVPIQVTSEGGAAPPPPSFEDIENEAEDQLAELEESESIDQYFQPRRISSPDGAVPPPRRISSGRRASVQAPPPEYTSSASFAFAPRSGGFMRSENAPSLYQALNMVR